MRPLEIAIAGCGPAGLAAALLLHRDGHAITLFDQFAAPRPIGSGLMIQPAGRAVLRAMGLESGLIAHGARIDRLLGRSGANGPVVLDVSYSALRRPGACGIGIHRAALFDLLFCAVEAAGLPVSTNRPMASSRALPGGRRCLVFADGSETGPFDLVVDALGTHSPLAPAAGRELPYGALWSSLDWPDGAGFDEHALEQRYRAASRMVGVLPIGTLPGSSQPKAAFFWSIKTADLPAWHDRGLEPWKREVEQLWPATAPLLSQIKSADCLTFARYAHRTLPRPVEPALIHIGDAWHSASPQLGQGANMALLDAWALALALRRHSDIADGLECAASLRRRHVRLYQALTAIFTPVYQSDSRALPFVRDRIVGPLSKLWPATAIQAAMVSGLIGNPLGPLDLTL